MNSHTNLFFLFFQQHFWIYFYVIDFFGEDSQFMALGNKNRNTKLYSGQVTPII